MAHYLDSGSNDPTQCLGYWFSQNIVDGIIGFHAQFGYYGYKALYPFGDAIKDIASAGNPVHLVLGSNKGLLKETDLRWTFGLIDGAADASLKVISFGNAEFHPKTICVQRADKTFAAAVGSANLTLPGLGRNAEAIITLDSSSDDPQLFQDMIAAVQRWQAGIDGVYPVTSTGDIDDLKLAKLIGVPQPPVVRPGRQSGSAPGVNNPGTRTSSWTPPIKPAAMAAPAPPTIPPKSPGTATRPQATATLPAARGSILWQKQLVASDCGRQQGNITGGVRLNQASYTGLDGNLIDWTTYFRELFDGFDWYQTRVTPFVEDADVPFHLVRLFDLN